MDYTCFCVMLICISYVSSTQLHYDARVTVKSEGITRFSFENNNNIDLAKLVTSGNKIIWVEGNKSLYSIVPTQASRPHQVNVTLCKDESKDSDSSHCSYRISLLREGVDRNLLFICRSHDGNTECCNLNSSYSQIDCFMSENYEPDINEPSLLVGITRFSFENNNNIDLAKLVTSGNKMIWVGGNKSLYSIVPTQASRPHQVNMTLCKDESKDSDSSHCSYRISLLRESVDRNLLFICRSHDGNTECCNLNSSYSQIDCFMSENYEPDINEPSLLVGNMLYFTKSEKGLYRINRDDKNDNIWPQSNEAEQTYLKLITGKGQHRDKVYSFFAEKQKSRDGEFEQWIPRVSQSCMNDKGGPKSHLQSSWTSMIFTRLFCGRGYEFTQMIDVATLETDSDTKIYALFRNYWNMSAVCVYNMTEISTIFTSSQFNSTKVPANHRPGTCVRDSIRLSSEVLAFMKDRPEMKDWVMPENGPMLFRHQHYTHIQVDRVRSHTVLLLSLESGGVHKVLEESVEQPVFIIAEYLPFPQGTHITSMLLDAAEKRLYVSSSNEVVQMDLQLCHMYGDDCNECRLSRDPYCGWNGLHCTSAAKNPVQDINCTDTPQAAPSKTEISPETPVIHILPSSKHFLLCLMTSHHATYHWEHGRAREECVHSEQGCLYLIESMNETHEGTYRCVFSEEGYQRTVTRYKLSTSRSDALRLTPVLLPSFLLLLTAFHVLLLNLYF